MKTFKDAEALKYWEERYETYWAKLVRLRLNGELSLAEMDRKMLEWLKRSINSKHNMTPWIKRQFEKHRNFLLLKKRLVQESID